MRAQPNVERILVSDAMFSKVAQMRYRVYCEEMGFLEKDKYPTHQETDEYDGQSIHVVVRVGNRLVGYARVIIPNGEGLPIFKHFSLPNEHQSDDSCEISRFMISQVHRHKTETRREIFRLLAEEILKIIEEQHVKVVYAVVEDWLYKSLQKRGYAFEMIGEGHRYMGAVTYPTKLILNNQQ